MLVYPLDEMETETPLREFLFANANEPDEQGGDSKLEIKAKSFSIERL